jgi:hypothetical protein
VCPFTRLASSLARQKVMKADGIRGHIETFNIPQASVIFLVNATVQIARAARLIVVAGNQCLEEDMLRTGHRHIVINIAKQVTSGLVSGMLY